MNPDIARYRGFILKINDYYIMSYAIFKDKNLRPENIKKGVKIFRTVGTLEESGVIVNEDITANSSTALQSFTAGEGYNGIGLFTLLPYVLDTKSLDPSTASQTITSSEDGMSSVSVSAVTASIDSNIQQENIKSGVTILGVTGTLKGGGWVSLARLGTLTDLSSYSLADAVTVDYGCSRLFENSSITQIPSLGSSSVGRHGLYLCFHNCTSLSSVSADITTVNQYGMQDAFNGCSSLTSVSFPYLTTINTDGAKNTFTNCNNLTTLNIHPMAVSVSENSNITTSMGSSVTNLTFSANATQDVHLSNLTSLNFNSVLNVLTHLDFNSGSHTVYFGNLTIEDDVQNSIQNAVNAAETAGWSITGLTIV